MRIRPGFSCYYFAVSPWRFTKMRKVVFGIAVVPIVLSLAVFAQDEPPPPAPPQKVEPVTASPCPKITIQAPAGRILRDGQPVAFAANLTGGDPSVTPIINWSLSAGSIRDGQGTRQIHVDSTGAGANREIVAELWVGGYASECGTFQATASVRVAGPATKVDEFGDLAVEQESERLANLASVISQTNDNVYIFAYAGRTNVRGYANTAARRLRTQLVTSGVPAGRVAATDAGFREQPTYEIWIVPEGADPPRPTPTVDRKEIVYPKTTPVKKTVT